jgi:hypothetical protein
MVVSIVKFVVLLAWFRAVRLLTPRGNRVLEAGEVLATLPARKSS